MVFRHTEAAWLGPLGTGSSSLIPMLSILTRPWWTGLNLCSPFGRFLKYTDPIISHMALLNEMLLITRLDEPEGSRGLEGSLRSWNSSHSLEAAWI